MSTPSSEANRNRFSHDCKNEEINVANTIANEAITFEDEVIMA